MKTEISKHATFSEANAAMIELRGIETMNKEDYLIANGNLKNYEEKNYNIEMVNDEFVVCEYSETISAAASAMGKKGGSATTPRKKSASAANLDAARKAGKVGGYPKGRPRNKRGAELYDLQKEYNDLKTQPDGELIGSFEDFVNDAVRQNSRQYPTLAEERKKSGMIII